MGGRPTRQTPKVIKAAREYLGNYEKFGDVIPSIAGLAVAIKVHRSMLYAWAKHDTSPFQDILADILDKQEQVLWTKGLSGEFNSNLVKLALGKHGYHDKQEVTGDINVTSLSRTERSARLASILDSARARGGGQVIEHGEVGATEGTTDTSLLQ